MSSTKTPGGKRATLPRASDHTKSFAKDWARLTHSGRFNMKCDGRLAVLGEEVVDRLTQQILRRAVPLEPEELQLL